MFNIISMNFILEICWIVFVLFIWFDTEAFIEYFRLTPLRKLFKIDLFDKYKKEMNPGIDYHSYLRQKHGSFITKLITCVPCTNFWIVLLISLLFNNMALYPIIYISSYVIYKIIKKHIHG